MTDMEIGPWFRNIAMSQPTIGRSVNAAGGVNAWKLPALVGEEAEMSVFR